MNEWGYFVLDDDDQGGSEADPVPTFEYPGDADIPEQMEKIIVFMFDQLGEAFARMIIGAETCHNQEDVKAFEEYTNRIRYSISAAGLNSVYKCSPKGKGKRGARKMAGKLGGERW